MFQPYHVHGAMVFMDRQLPLDEWQQLGEVHDTLRTYNGENPLAPPGDPGCQVGKDEWFAQGVPEHVLAGVRPDCCVPPGIPRVEHRLGEAGFPIIEIAVFGDQQTTHAVFFAMIEGGGVPPPFISAGWTILLNQQLAGHDVRLICGWRAWSDPPPLPFFIAPPAPNLLDSCVMLGVKDSHVGVYAWAFDEVLGAPSVSAPSLASTGSRDLLLICWWQTGTLNVIGYPAGMVEELGGNGVFAAYNTMEKGQVGLGPTGDKVALFGVPRDAVAISLLIK